MIPDYDKQIVVYCVNSNDFCYTTVISKTGKGL